MTLSGKARLASRLSAAFAAAAGLLALVALLGWAFDAPLLASLLPGQVTMKANTSIGLSALCAALLALNAGRTRPAAALAAVPASLGLFVLLEYAGVLPAALDQILVVDPGCPATGAPGRMSPLTALALLLAGTGTLLQARGRRESSLSQTFFIISGLAGWAVLAGYALGARDFDRFGETTRMAANTAAAFLLCGMSGLLLNPDEGWTAAALSRTSAGAVTRRLLPLILLLPLAGGAAALLLERTALTGAREAVFLLMSFNTLAILVALLSWTAALHRGQGERLKATLALAEQKQLEALRQAFLSAVGHELRSPASAAGLLAGLLEGELAREGRPPGSKAAEYAGRISADLGRLLSFIDDLLLVSQASQGPLALARASVRAQDLAAEALAEAAPSFKARGVRLSSELDEELPPVHADAALLKRALGHALANALKFTPDGGAVALSARAARRQGRPWIELEVRDSGPGFSEESADSLFSAFKQGENIGSRAAGHQGAGLGLHIIRTVCAAHGGQALAEGSPSKGGRLRLLLPPAEPRA